MSDTHFLHFLAVERRLNWSEVQSGDNQLGLSTHFIPSYQPFLFQLVREETYAQSGCGAPEDP